MSRLFSRFSVLLTAVLAVAALAGLSLPAAMAAGLSYRVHFLGHTGVEAPAQTAADGMVVAADGTSFVVSSPPDGPPMAGRYRDGRWIGGTAPLPADARGEGGAIAVSENCIFLAVSLPAADAGGSRWHGVWRFTKEGEHAAFPGGRGPEGALAVVHETADGDNRPVIGGLWAHEDELFVSLTATDRVKVCDAGTLSEKRVLRASRPGPLCVVGGQLQIVERGAVVSAFDMNGRRTGQVLDEGDGLLPGALAPTREGRLMVADRGPSRQILFFNMSGVPTRVRTLGDAGGVQAPPNPGEVGPGRLAHVTGVGADAQGRLYVAMNPPPGGCVLRAYGPDRRSLLWQHIALALTHGADIDPFSDGLVVYSAEGRHGLDLTKPPGQSWRWAALTLDPARYPHDLRIRPRPSGLPPGPESVSAGESRSGLAAALPIAAPKSGGATTFREIDRHKLLVHRSQDGARLGVYRFVGHTAVPAIVIDAARSNRRDPDSPGRPDRSPWMWRDADGDGLMDEGETSAAPSFIGYFPANPVDAAGGLWLISTERSGVCRWPLRGFDAHGIPLHDADPASSEFDTLPAPPSLADVLYDSATDTLYKSTSVPGSPLPGSLPSRVELEILDDWKQDPAAAFKRWSDRLVRDSVSAPDGLAIAGSLLFVLNLATRVIDVHDQSGGKPTRIGQLDPPLALHSTGAPSSPALHAHRRRDGSYLVLVQDPDAPRILAYHLDDPAAAQSAKH